MKTIAFPLAVVILVVCCESRNNNLERRLMQSGKYITENCAESTMYDSLPVRFTRAMQFSRDSAERFVAQIERYQKIGKCPE